MGLTTPSHKTIIVEKPDKNSQPDPKIRRSKLWKKKHSLWLAICNIRTLNYLGALQNLKDQIRKYNIGNVKQLFYGKLGGRRTGRLRLGG
jgi:hypothetical protein